VTERPEPSVYPLGLKLGCVAMPLALVALIALVVFVPILFHEERPLASNCTSNVKQLLYACALYAGDNNEVFPPDLGSLMPGYFTDGTLLLCPKSRAPVERVHAGAVTDENMSYCYVSGLTAADDPGYVIAFDEEWNHEGKGVIYGCIGGQVSWQADIAALHARLAKQEAELATKGRKVKILRPLWSTWPDRPPWVDARSRFWWIAGGAVAGVLFLVAAVTLIVLRRRKRRGNGTPAP